MNIALHICAMSPGASRTSRSDRSTRKGRCPPCPSPIGHLRPFAWVLPVCASSRQLGGLPNGLLARGPFPHDGVSDFLGPGACASTAARCSARGPALSVLLLFGRTFRRERIPPPDLVHDFMRKPDLGGVFGSLLGPVSGRELLPSPATVRPSCGPPWGSCLLCLWADP